MLIPIGTDIRTRRKPVANYVIIGLNVAVFLLTDVFNPHLGNLVKARYALDAARPLLHQYITYQFLHGDFLHIAGNMLFLWIFGNAVCDRMGSLPYTMFYLAGGVFAGYAFAAGADNPLIGASGAIAAVTTAFLVLFPRVHITLLVWIVFIFTIQVPSLILIVLKMIVWDNILAPSLEAHGAELPVAHSAHLGGYAFGFAVALIMLGLRVLPRNQFDLLAVWSRWRRRTGLTVGGGVPQRAATTARPVRVEELGSKPILEIAMTPVEQLRERVARALSRRDAESAIQAYTRLIELDPEQVLSRPQQLEVANALAQARQYEAAAQAYEAFLDAYPAAPDVSQVRLFLGLIYSRYLQQYEKASDQLRKALEGLQLDAQRTLADEELRQAESRSRPDEP